MKAEQIMDQNSCKFPVAKLISDEPATEDRLEAHKNIASTLARIIRTEEGGKTIALSGTWGSGKSTIIKLAGQQLENPAHNIDTVIFTYDTWAHSGDPLRRSFLEKLIKALLEKKWLEKPTEWEDSLKELANRLEIVDTTTDPKLTDVGNVLAVFVYLLPLAFIYLGVYLRLSTYETWQHWVFGTSCLAILAPPFIVIYAAIREFRRQEKGKRLSTLGLLIGKSSEHKITTSQRTPEPTSVEFQDKFRKLIENCLTDENRRLVIVFDNLDRLDSEEIRAVWPALRTFSEISYKGDGYVKRLWVVVPFDPDGLHNVLNIPSGKKDETEDPNAIVSDDTTTKRYFDKTFQIELRVPPPILSNWRLFFLSTLEKAFGKNDEISFNRIYRIFRASIQDRDQHPTPRSVIKFINRLITMYHTWGDTIPLSAQTAYLGRVRQ